MTDAEYTLLRLKSLEAIVHAFMHVFARTATLEQLDLLSEIGRKANIAADNLDEKFNGAIKK